MGDTPIDLDAIRAARKQAANDEPVTFQPGAVLVEVARLVGNLELILNDLIIVAREPIKDKPGHYNVRVFAGGMGADRHTFVGILEDAKYVLLENGKN